MREPSPPPQKPPETKKQPTPGLFRYRAGILALASILLIYIATSYSLSALTRPGARKSAPGELALISPDNAIAFFQANTTVEEVLTEWEIDTSGFKDDVLTSRVQENGRITIIDSPGGKELRLSPLSAGECFILGIPFDINGAEAEALTLIPGIGEKTAHSIIKYRDTHGPFSKSDDLMKVRGVGSVRAEVIGRYVTFGETETTESR
jgi:competence ComEA-like helix-hairpin-helix protein